MSSPTNVHPSPSTAPPKRSPFRWRPDQQWEGYLLLLPSFAGILVFVVLAVLMSLNMSFQEWTLTGARGYVGLQNYLEVWRDPVFWKTFWNTVFYIVTIVPMQLALGLAMAVALNQAIRGKLVYRLVYFMPVVTTIVAGAIVFRLLLSNNGPVNNLIAWCGNLIGQPIVLPNWLGSTQYSKWSVVILTLWKGIGFTMVVYLAALQGVPQELYDAASVDGASAWRRFRNVTVPLISPTTFFLFVWQTIGAFSFSPNPSS